MLLSFKVLDWFRAWKLLNFYDESNFLIGIYLFKVNNRIISTMSKMCPRLTIKIQSRHHWRRPEILITNFEQISPVVLSKWRLELVSSKILVMYKLWGFIESSEILSAPAKKPRLLSGFIFKVSLDFNNAKPVNTSHRKLSLHVFLWMVLILLNVILILLIFFLLNFCDFFFLSKRDFVITFFWHN